MLCKDELKPFKTNPSNIMDFQKRNNLIANLLY